MNPITKTEKVALAVAFFSFAMTAVVFSQKLPNVQEVGLRTPSNLKIDGKAAEWNNTFQANNNHTQFYYSMANDDANLYLIVQATDQAIVRRILNGGITLTINKSGDKKEKGAPGVTYPVFAASNRFRPSFRPATPPGTTVRISSNSVPVSLTPAQADSLMQVNNKNLGERAKSIRTANLAGVDTLLSIYNDEGVKAASSFDNKLAYTCELLVPLKYFGLSGNGPGKFLYQVRINEVETSGVLVNGAPAGGATFQNMSATGVEGVRSISIGPNAQVGQPATDFWGEYILK